MKLGYRAIVISVAIIMSHTLLSASDEKIYEGVYSRGFEYSVFQATDSSEAWWL